MTWTRLQEYIDPAGGLYYATRGTGTTDGRADRNKAATIYLGRQYPIKTGSYFPVRATAVPGWRRSGETGIDVRYTDAHGIPWQTPITSVWIQLLDDSNREARL